MPPALPDKETWRRFKADRHDFQPGTCEHCKQPTERLRWHEVKQAFVCPSCWAWIETVGR